VEGQAHEGSFTWRRRRPSWSGRFATTWDVQCAESRWWVVTNPTNLYDQADFKSRDVVLTFHIGLMLRAAAGK